MKKNIFLLILLLFFCVNKAYPQRGQLVKDLKTDLPIECLAVSYDKAIIALAEGTNYIYNYIDSLDKYKIAIINSSDYSAKAALYGHNDKIVSLSFSYDSKKIVSVDNGGTVIVWNIETHEELNRIETNLWINKVAFTSSGNKIIISDNTNEQLVVLDLLTKKRAILKLDSFIGDFDYNPKTNQIYLSLWDKIEVWDFGSKTLIKAIEILGANKIRLSNDKNMFAVGTDLGNLFILNEKFKTVAQFDDFLNSIISICFSFDDSRIMASSIDKHVRVWSIKDQSPIMFKQKIHEEELRATEYINKKNRFISIGNEIDVKIWD